MLVSPVLYGSEEFRSHREGVEEDCKEEQHEHEEDQPKEDPPKPAPHNEFHSLAWICEPEERGFWPPVEK